MLFLLICAFLPTILCHSWMTCPPSFVITKGRGGFQHKLCETSGDSAFVTYVEAGDRLKVGWTSNNHAGGFVRISLVPFGAHTNESFESNVMKFVCYGHDSNDLNSKRGDCNHPCNARGGCEYQSDQYNIERYDTTIGIPTNLPEGLYTLHLAMLVGNSQIPYYSCAKLHISKGNPSFTCASNKPPLTYSCLKTGGGALSVIKNATRRGDFCYNFDGTIGNVDDRIRHVPINVGCDPRLTCDNAIHIDKCKKSLPNMTSIIHRGGEAIQPNCQPWNVIPPPIPSCDDNVQNRDEEGIDCGGTLCPKACPTIPSKVVPGNYFSDITMNNRYWSDGSGGQLSVTVNVTKNITDNQCWKLILQYLNPVDIQGEMWGDGKLAEENQQKTIFIIERGAKWVQNPIAGGKITVSFSAKNPKFTQEDTEENVIWSDDTMRLQSATKLEVYDDVTECKYQYPKEEWEQ